MNHLGLFSGIGGFEEAFQRVGANLIAMCEIEPQARRVLRRHFAGVEIINDVKEIARETFAGRTIDLITGGFPCQDLSVAGHRKGLDGERSGLWFEYLRIIADHKPRWVVVENVPGLLSSYSGDDPPGDLQEGEEWEAIEESDFAIILRGLVECGYGVAWRVFDSQFDGVAQRRERVFIVASFGDASCAEVLFEREGGAWDHPPSREAGQRVTALTANGVGTCGADDNHAQGGHLVHVAHRLRAFGDYEEDCKADALQSRDYKDATDLIVHPQVTHALTSEGADASEDGTGRGTPIIAYNIQQNDGGDHKRKDRPNGGFYVRETDTALTVGSTDQTVVAFSSKDYGNDAQQDIAPTLRSMNFDKSHINGGGQVAVAYPLQEVGKRTGQSTDDVRCGVGIGADGDPMYTLQSGAQHGVVAFTERTRAEGRNLETQDELAYALTNPGSGGRTHSRQIAGEFGVRRLTPLECERLQGYPDGWTERGDDGLLISDSARYRMLGNAVCLPTVGWIARRILLT